MSWLSCIKEGCLGDTSGKEPACQCRTHKRCDWSLGEDDPAGGHGNPLQYSCLETPMDRGALVSYGPQITKNWTWLKRLGMHAHIKKVPRFHLVSLQTLKAYPPSPISKRFLRNVLEYTLCPQYGFLYLSGYRCAAKTKILKITVV